MPIIKSAKKDLKQSKERQKRNNYKRKKIKKLVKQAQGLIAENKTKEAKELLPQIYKALDKAAKTGVIKKNTSSRKKSRIAKSFQKSS